MAAGLDIDLSAISAGWVAEPWASSLTVRAMLEATLLGLATACLGTWVLLYRLTYATESVTHAMLPGLVVSALLGLPLLVGALGGLALAAATLTLVGAIPRISGDSAVAVVVTGLTGLGVLGALVPSVPAGLDDLLFGDLLGVTDTDLLVTGALVVLIAACMPPLHARLMAVGFDRGVATSLVRSPTGVELALIGLVTLTIAVGAQAMGNLLVFALLIAPAATARLLVSGIVAQMAVGLGVAVGAALVGIYLSHFGAVAAGSSMALALVVAYTLAVAWRLVARLGRRTALVSATN